jgi:hypothetical protein
MDFTIDGDPVWFHGITGTVKGLRNWSSSDVSSSGGGGFVTKEGGYIAPPKITTTVNQHQKFWIVSESGHEKEVSNPNLHCRDGHWVTLIWGNDKSKENGGFLLFKNHTTNEKYLLNTFFCTKKLSTMLTYQIGIVFLSIIIFIMMFLLLAIKENSDSLFLGVLCPFLIIIFIISLVYLIVMFTKNWRNIKLKRKKYSLFIDSLLENKEFRLSII